MFFSKEGGKTSNDPLPFFFFNIFFSSGFDPVTFKTFIYWLKNVDVSVL